MAPSAISTPIEESNHYSNGIRSLNSELENMHLPRTTTSNTALSRSAPDTLLDLVCVGFGPASLAIAIALHDIFTSHSSSYPSSTPKTLFLEKQPQFAWHAGMQLPGAKMQISFLKDLATPRDPRSKFTFMNYLFSQGRLNQFINLGTFLPSRMEYEDYLRWCAQNFEREGKVAYGIEVEGVRPFSYSTDGKVTSWEVSARDASGKTVVRRARHVVIAVGGKPVMPTELQGVKGISHSSQFATTIGKIQASEKEKGRSPRFAVIGSGQSAAEIYNDLCERFEDAQVRLVIRGASLRPSDDSPFVNEIFDPDRVDTIFAQPPTARAAQIALDKGTNYGVVRLSLLEQLYEAQYMQRLRQPDASLWRHKILSQKSVLSASNTKSGAVTLKIKDLRTEEVEGSREEELEVDYVFVATGYKRDAHVGMLAEVLDLLPEELRREGKFAVERNYRVMTDDKKVDKSQAGIWLQGCNEGTHGLSDTLLSILAIRGGELVNSIFARETSSAVSTDISESASLLSSSENSGLSSPA